MPDQPKGSGADLARQALAAARATAKNSPAPAPRKTRSTRRRSERGGGRDPITFGNLLGKVSAEQGWPAALDGGSVLARWPELCPQFATTVQPVRYDPDRGVLELRPSTHTIASGLRLLGGQLARQINDKLGRPVVHTVRVLPVGASTTPEVPASTGPAAAPAGPVRTRETASPGYRAALNAALTHKPDRQPTNPYVVEAIQRQEAALRARRQPESEHREAFWAQQDAAAGPAPGSVEESLARARAYARQERAGGQMPRRAFDVA